MANFDTNTQRDQGRIDKTGEVFTPTALVNEILDKLTVDWGDATKTFIDPTCGNSQFLVEVKQRLLDAGHNEQHILENMIYGADLMVDNVKLSVYRLCVDSSAKTIPGYALDFSLAPDIVVNPKGYKVNICCADGIKWDYTFDRFDAHIHQKQTRSLDGHFYLEYLKEDTSVADSDMFDW